MPSMTRMKKNIIPVFFLIAFSFHLHAQNGFLKKISTSYGIPNLIKAIETYDGSIVCLGRFDGNTQDFVSGFISKRTSTGAEVWTKTLGNNLPVWLFDDPVEIIETKDSCYLIVCNSMSSDRDGDYAQGFYLVKFTENGDTVFHKRYDNSLYEYWGPYSMIESDDGSLHCLINTTSYYSGYSADSSFMQLISLNKDGDIYRIKKFMTLSTTYALQIINHDNAFFIYGPTNAPDTSAWTLNHSFAAKIDSSGNVVWSKTYSSTADSIWAMKMLVKDQNILLVGRTSSFPNPFIATMLDSVGNPVFGKKFHKFRVYDFCFNPDSTLTWMGFLNDSINWGHYLIKSDFFIDTLSLSNLSDSSYLEFNSDYITSTSGNGILAGGSFWTNTDTTFYLLKTDSTYASGCVLNPGVDSLLISPVLFTWDTLMLQVETPDTFYMSYPFPYLAEYDISMSNVFDVCILSSVSEMPTSSTNLYPNPFTERAMFEIESSKSKMRNCELHVYNTLGVLVRKEKISDLNSYILYRGSLSEGMYFYELRTTYSGITGTGKFIIQ